MNRQTRAIFFGLIILVGILAASTTFFFQKSRNLNSPPSSKETAQVTAIDSGSTSSPAPARSSQVSQPASSSEKPSQPQDTYTIQRGEGLYAVAEAQGTTSGILAEANGITDYDKIQAGQVLVVPKGSIVNFILDNTKATELQKAVDAGRFPFRLSPEDTASSDAPPVFGLKVTDTFTLRNKDENQGTAIVVAAHEGKNYLIKLTQPVTKGSTGIWAIESIQPAT